MARLIALIPLVLILVCCKVKTKKPIAVACNELLSNCAKSTSAEYCTLGYKWGAENPYSNGGYNKPGPGKGDILISYRFEKEGVSFNSHSKDNLQTLSWDNSVICAKEQARLALQEWARVTNISFEERKGTDKADITIILSDIEQGGIAYPPFPNEPCAGLVIFDSVNYSCNSFYELALHEFGHVLGLGHVPTANVMNPNRQYSAVQAGDIKGIQSIYGVKK
jgi:hypothetical protein